MEIHPSLIILGIFIGIPIGVAIIVPVLHLKEHQCEYWFSEAKRHLRLYHEARNAANRRVREGDEWKEG